MASEKRLIDANKVPYHQSGFPKGDGFDSGLDWAFREDIDKIPTVDAVEVVRCKDCDHRADVLDCGNYLCNRKMIGMVRPDDFCSFGERREA